MDFVKTRMQVPGCQYTGMVEAFQQIVKAEGFLALYTGLDSELLKSAVQHFVYFYVYAFLKDFAQSRKARQIAASLGLCACDDGPTAVFPDLSRQNSISADTTPAQLQQLQASNSNSNSSAFMPMCCGACFKPVHMDTSALEISFPSTATATAGGKATHRPSLSVLPGPPQLNMLTNLAIGMLAGCVTQLFVTPLSVVQTRIMTAGKAADATVARLGIFAMITKIAADEGVGALFAGIIPGLVLTSNPAIQFLVFDRLKLVAQQFIHQWQQSNAGMTMTLPAAYSFLIGAIAKIVATVITYPYIMAKVRLQWKGDASSVKYTGTLHVMASILSENGIFGLYTGLRAQMLKSVLGAALMFMGKEKIMAYAELLVNALRAQKVKKL